MKVKDILNEVQNHIAREIQEFLGWTVDAGIADKITSSRNLRLIEGSIDGMYVLLDDDHRIALRLDMAGYHGTQGAKVLDYNKVAPNYVDHTEPFSFSNLDEDAAGGSTGAGAIAGSRGLLFDHPKRKLRTKQPKNPKSFTDRYKVTEKWDKEAELNPEKKGMFKGRSKESIESELAKLKASGPHKKGSTQFTKEKELNFAKRAKSGWKK